MTLTRDQLRAVGESLYGASWQTPLAADLSVAVRTIQRWVSGERAVPAGLKAELSEICEARGKSLTELARKL